MSNNLTLLIDLCNQHERLPSNIETKIFNSDDNSLIQYYLDKIGVKENGCVAFRLYYYARYIIKDRWYEAEPIIATNACWAYCYAKNVIKDRWYEAETVITTNKLWASGYCKHFSITESELCS